MSQQPDLLKGLQEEDCLRILALGTRVSLPSSAEVFALGAKAECMYIVERGRIKLTMPIQVHGKQEDILVEEINSGQTIGWSGLIPPHRFTLKATVLVDAELISLPGEALRDYFAANPMIGCTVSLNLAGLIGHRLQLSQAMWLREIQRIVELRYE
jgi:CRP/FNR family transcriptional regulator, cyclic AMP receptor protein